MVKSIFAVRGEGGEIIFNSDASCEIKKSMSVHLLKQNTEIIRMG